MKVIDLTSTSAITSKGRVVGKIGNTDVYEAFIETVSGSTPNTPKVIYENVYEQLGADEIVELTGMYRTGNRQSTPINMNNTGILNGVLSTTTHIVDGDIKETHSLNLLDNVPVYLVIKYTMSA